MLYHVGCLTSYDKDMQRLARRRPRCCRRRGVDFGIAGDAETCCGGRAYEMGYEDDFLAQAAKSMEVIRSSRAPRRWSPAAPRATRPTHVLYDRFGLKGDLQGAAHQPVHRPSLLAEGKLKPSKAHDLNVTYHDPCHLGRLGEPWIHWQGHEGPRRPLHLRSAEALPARHERRLRASARRDHGACRA